MASTLIGLLEAALKLWSDKEANKYRDELISLKEAWYEEFNRGAELRDLAVLSDIELKLRILADSLSAAIGKSAP